MSKKYPGGLINKTPPTPSGSFTTDTAPGVWTLEQQAYWQKQGLWPTAGNLPPPYIEDVFSTYLYAGNGSTQTITNGINLAGNGGLTWIKARNNSGVARNNRLWTTNLTGSKVLQSDSTAAIYDYGSSQVTFNSNGFGLSSDGGINAGGDTYASWTFREQPKFFDVVTYTGTGGGPSSVAHALGSVPGCVIIKSTSRAGNWVTVSRMSTGNYAAFVGSSSGLQSTAAADSTTYNLAGAGAVTSTTFDPSWWNANGTVGAVNNICDNGVTYVAYLFAHDAGGFGLNGTDSVISCGSYTGNGLTAGPTINLGWEPQWILEKRIDGASNWHTQDNMRGMPLVGNTALLIPNTDQIEYNGGIFFAPIATGFQVATSNAAYNASGGTYIYIAIRRGPMKTPTTGTSVFSPVPYAGNGGTQSITTGFPVDLEIVGNRTGGQAWAQGVLDRLRGNGLGLASTSTAAEVDYSTNMPTEFQSNTGVNRTTAYYNSTGQDFTDWAFRRAPGFFDVVCYTAPGSNFTIQHNLTVSPELVIAKSRNINVGWGVYYTANGANTNWMTLNSNNAQGANNGTLANGSYLIVSSTQLQIDFQAFAAQGNMVAYLFATCPGVSKVGKYIGTGALQTINCGFAAGARFVLIKRVDSTGDWYVWDSARGISSGNDPYLTLNTAVAEVTGTNYVDTTAVGFQVTAAAPAELNVTGGTYIFLAIA